MLLLACVLLVLQYLFRCCTPRAVQVQGQLPAGCWPCRVWLAQLAATLLEAAAEEWQRLVPVAFDCLVTFV